MKTTNVEMTFTQLKEACPVRMAECFANYFAKVPSIELRAAIEYSLNNGGKYVRPLLVYASGLTFYADWNNLDLAACAVELIHTYSLIHDDLPCMDNADLRRGKPSSHKAFSESTAILTGDALQSLAFQLLSSHSASLSCERRLEMIERLSQAAGPYGMVSGQMMDLNLLQGQEVSEDLLLETFRLKTGAMISVSVQLGWLASNDSNELNEKAMLEFGQKIGLAFQIQDDILDVEAHTSLTGKPQYADETNKKTTYLNLFGIENAKQRVADLHDEALEAINYLGGDAAFLRELANSLLIRKK